MTSAFEIPQVALEMRSPSLARYLSLSPYGEAGVGEAGNTKLR